MSEINRRDFVQMSAVAACGAAGLGCFSESTGPTTPNASVSAVRGSDLYSMTRDALDAIGGIETVVNEGESVFIKPNMVTLPWGEHGNRFTIGECTKPEIVITVAEECLRVGASEVVIGDGSQQRSFDWEYAVTLDGSTNLVREAARLSDEYGRTVRCASLEADSPSWIEIPSNTYLNTIATSSLVANADRVISIPVAKTHSWAQLTLATKNFVGVTSQERYAQLLEGGNWDRGAVFDHRTPEAISAIFLDVVAGVQPDLAVIDFSIGIEANGPTLRGGLGRTVDMQDRLGSWLVLASTDIMAADATSARIMSHSVGNTVQLGMGYEMGLGEIRREYIEIIGDDLDSLQVEWQAAELEERNSFDLFGPGACPSRRHRHRSHRYA